MRSRFLKGALAVVAIVATAGLFPVAASAATFDYSLSGGFFFDPNLPQNTLPNPTQGNGTLGGLELSGPVSDPTGLPAGSTAPANTYRDIGWGCAANGTNCAAAGTNVVAESPFDGANAAARSALRVDTVRGAGDPIQLTSPVAGGTEWTGPLTGITANFDATPTSGDITSDGTWVFISNIFHDNSAIDDDSINLIDAIIRTNLFLSSGFSQLDSDVRINFEETFNAEPCANPVGDPCADRFTFTTDTFGAVTFQSGGVTYLLQFDLFTNDPNIVIEGNTVWTGEGDINDLWVIMRLTEVAVPLPGSLLLLGAGFLGTAALGVVRRRRAIRK
jgi:hypothetical protein